VIAAAFSDASLKGWDGFGLGGPGLFSSRAEAVIGYSDELARALNRRSDAALRQGCLLDTEIKRAQERGLDGFPVFTRKAMTDLELHGCARQMLALRPPHLPAILPPTRAFTVATVLGLQMAKTISSFKRLHGNGRGAVRAIERGIVPTWPVAPMRGRQPTANLLGVICSACCENGANSPSWRSPPTLPCGGDVLRRPRRCYRDSAKRRHPNIRAPRDLYQPHRENSRAWSSAIGRPLNELVSAGARRSVTQRGEAHRCDGGADRCGDIPRERDSRSGADAADHRATILERARTCWSSGARIHHAAATRGRQDLDDAVSESARRVDFCRYYAAEGRKLFGDDKPCPDRPARANVLKLRGPRVFHPISPWNFSVAIFLGQATAALMAGNAVVAKPAEQTPLIAAEAVPLAASKAGVPHRPASDARRRQHRCLHWSRMPNWPAWFHGSTEVAAGRSTGRSPPERPNPPLHRGDRRHKCDDRDATALPEQVADDVVTSAFRSAGQRCRRCASCSCRMTSPTA